MKIEKAIEISDAKIQFVSLVDKAANKRQFLIAKAEDGQAQFSTLGKVLKVDADTHYITGIVYEPLTEDAHGNYMTESEIRKAAYWFAKNGDQVDLQHSFEQVQGVSVVETYVTPSDMTVEGQSIIKGTWLMTVEVENADVWDKVQKGEVTGFSMGGIGKYSETETDIETVAEKRGLFKKLAGLFGFDVVEKAGKKISAKNHSALQSIYDNLGQLLSEFSEEKEEIEVTKAEVQAIVKESITSALSDINLSNVSEPVKTESELTADAVEQMISEAIQKALEPKEVPEAVTAEMVQQIVADEVTKAVEPILKARGMSSNLNNEKTIEKHESQHYLAGIL